MALVRDFKELRTYRAGFEAAMRIFDLSKQWPRDERYALTDQVRRSSRSICSSLAEAWFKRRYVPSFINKLSDASAEAAETLVWLDFAQACGYIDAPTCLDLEQTYRQILGGLTKMMAEPEAWCGPAALREAGALYDSATGSGLLPGDEPPT
jgi:four helix bundle protein